MRAVAGDYKAGYVWVKRSLFGKPKGLGFRGAFLKYDMVAIETVRSFSIMDRDKSTSWLGKLGWGAAVGLVLGPAGALGGMLASGNKDESIAEMTAIDGRRALLKGSSKEIRELFELVYTLGAQGTGIAQGAAQK